MTDCRKVRHTAVSLPVPLQVCRVTACCNRGAYSQPCEDGDLRVYRKDKPDQEAVFVLRFVEGNCIRLQRKVDRMNQKSCITLLFAARVLQFSDDEFENNEWR